MTRYLWAFVATLLAMLVLDAVWLGLLARDLYQEGIGPLMRAQPLWAAALAFYLMYAAGLVWFAVRPQRDQPLVRRAALAGALLGLVAYGTYDLSNLATLNGWPVHIVLVDMVWGAVVSAASAAAGQWAWNRRASAGRNARS
jgi:uncharacterized membrane protein